VCVLEGGYNLETLSKATEATLRSLLKEPLPYKVCREQKTFEELKSTCCPIAYCVILGRTLIKNFSQY